MSNLNEKEYEDFENIKVIEKMKELENTKWENDRRIKKYFFE